MGIEKVRDLLLSQASPVEAQIIRMRDEFTQAYCVEKEWDMENLSMKQLLELRSQPEWRGVERRRCCPFCQFDLGLGVGMGTMIRECQCEQTLIWIPTSKGGHWDPFTQAHFERMHSDFSEALDVATYLGSRDEYSG